ncbi:DUF2304 domain-containing protein [Kitasatospora sp. MAP5-34]|uniref:DUF2304 domain-containing protein n=1 Tax=Kitasatospora sp. MAP5-34 TaxID=3035102 RepID=UPI002475B47E|nr:DUF2304 domain-containing protein [Kitasatospora sp. MAP5-34]MDH6580862.1 hypothetical protein [Kitasatospora sp. MAP5-34]
MPLFILTSLAGIVVLVSVVRTLRLNGLRQRSAALWICLSLVVLPVMFVPTLLDPVAALLRVSSGADLALAFGLVVLLYLAVTLSREQHGLRARSDLLASELSSLRAQLGLPAAAPAIDGPPPAQSPAAPAPPIPRDSTEDSAEDGTGDSTEGRFADLLEDGSIV